MTGAILSPAIRRDRFQHLNGIALRYAREVRDALAKSGLDLPVFIGGRLNQVPEDTNTGLPVDVSQDIAALGVTPCLTPEALTQALTSLVETRDRMKTPRVRASAAGDVADY